MNPDYSYDTIGENLIEQAKKAMREEAINQSKQPEFYIQNVSNDKYSLRTLSDSRIQDLLNSIERF
ncbi:MAG: hypothetical protein ACW981_05780 [Candidatus Hodarchaeales archaeon]|jgi:hypothetical protein